MKRIATALQKHPSLTVARESVNAGRAPGVHKQRRRTFLRSRQVRDMREAIREPHWATGVTAATQQRFQRSQLLYDLGDRNPERRTGRSGGQRNRRSGVPSRKCD